MTIITYIGRLEHKIHHPGINLNILVLYYSRGGKTSELANIIASSIEANDIKAVIKTVPSSNNEETSSSSHNIVTVDDIKRCSGLALGSPTRFGTMASSLAKFFEQNVEIWHKGYLENKPGCVFSSTATYHGGQEATLLNLMVPLLHHGMSIVGIPYSKQELNTTTSGGSPYGASHISGIYNQNEITKEERALCFELGKRLALHAKAMSSLEHLTN